MFLKKRTNLYICLIIILVYCICIYIYAKKYNEKDIYELIVIIIII